MSYSGAADLKTANKDQAILCEERARQALAAGEIDRAVRLTQKSLRLFRTDRAEKLLQEIYSASLKKKRSQEPKPQAEPELRRRHPSESQSQSQTSGGGESNIACTPEQEAEIRRIKRTKDYYEILGVQRTATDTELKKTFRKLALRMHPDKCGHPEAAEVFKKITAAYQCLSDENKRNIYDQTGHDDDQQRGHAGPAAFRHDMFPEDIAEMFFNHANMRRSRFHAGQRNYYRARAPRAQQGQTIIPPQLIQLLPLLLLFAFSWLNSPSYEEPFSLDRSGSYQISRTTKANKIQYFVSPSFVRHYTRDARALYQVEEEVEQQYHSRLKTKCKREKDNKRKLERKARQATDASRAAILEKAYNMRLPACEKLETLFVRS